MRAGTLVAEVTGRARALLTAERTALNIMQRLSGIATLTRHYVDAARGSSLIVLDTRKTTPTLRVLEKYAVRAGGGTNHRFALDDGILIKDNHIALAGGVVEALRRMREAAVDMIVEVEVRTPRGTRRRARRRCLAHPRRQHGPRHAGRGRASGEGTRAGRSVGRGHARPHPGDCGDRRGLRLGWCPHALGAGGGFELQDHPGSVSTDLATWLAAVRSGVAAAGVDAGAFGQHVSVLTTTGSTNDDVARAAFDGAPEGYTVIAGEQTAGRGRRGAAWYSPAAHGLYLSTLLRPDRWTAVRTDPASPASTLVTLMAGVAVVSAIGDVCQSSAAELKWPNDVMVRRRRGALRSESGVAQAGAVFSRRAPAKAVRSGPSSSASA